MAKPRIFVSSTFYDLKQIRADLERFIKDYNFDPILNERGSIAYGKESELEDYCYREVENSDMLISVIGGRFGSHSKDSGFSVSQKELDTAIKNGKQVYIFVEKNVLAEYQTFLANKGKEIKCVYVDDVKVYEFLEKIMALPKNNPIHGFETAQDITSFLKEQWTGLIYRLLQDDSRRKEMNLLEGIESTARTLNDLVVFLRDEKSKGDKAIDSILLMNHPAMEQMRTILNVPYRVFFTTRKELAALVTARRLSPVNEKDWDSPDYIEWFRTVDNKIHYLKVNASIFNQDGKLIIFTNQDWDLANIKYEIRDIAPDEYTAFEEDPF